MKKFIYNLFGKFGYKIENRRKRKSEVRKKLQRFGALQNLSLLVRANRYINKLQETYPELTISDHQNGVMVSFSDAVFYIESPEEFFILSEVFLEKDYRFIDDKQCILIDIGANIGISSLFFLKNNNVKKIYAFEPVEDTYRQALQNFSLNNVGQSVELHNYGLGKNDRSETFIFNKDIKGNTGVRGKLSRSYANQNNLEERQVAIKNVSDVFTKIIAENPGMRLVVKMDCEGAEYEIIESLNASGHLKNIDVWMIEWHDKGADSIETALKNAGYFIFSRQLAVNAGMIHAVKH